jgi:hypothetical protein
MKNKKQLTSSDIINKTSLLSTIHDGRFRVAIFGSARIRPEDFVYQEIVELAKRITKNDFDIVTGGGPGAMEAASY